MFFPKRKKHLVSGIKIREVTILVPKLALIFKGGEGIYINRLQHPYIK